MWEPIELPSTPGRVVAVSELVGARLAVWTDAGVHIIKLHPRPRLLETLAPHRGPERFNLATGCFLWRMYKHRMHGECGPGGAVVGEPLPTSHPTGMTLQRDGDRLLVRDVNGAVRQVIEGCGGSAAWSVAGLLDYGSDRGRYLLVAHPGSVRLFRYFGAPEGGGAVWQRAGDAVTQQSLLRAVIENPDDDTQRLVYADWLEEHGDPARAEFVRLHCRLAERLQSAEVPFQDPDSKRVFALASENGDRWAAELPALPGVEYSFYRAFRGFPEVSFPNADALIQFGGRLGEVTPIEAVRFTRLPPTQLARLLKTPFPAGLVGLSVQDVPARAAQHLAAWLRSPHAARLRRLTARRCPEWPLVLQAVADSRYLGRLEHLHCDRGREGPAPEDVVLAVARSPHLPRLRQVYFACWPLYPEATQAELLRRFPTMPR